MTGRRRATESSSAKPKLPDVPPIVIDQRNKRQYKKGDFLGKGGFARCFELVDSDTGILYAGKVIAKSQLTRSGQKQKMLQEIDIHRSIHHEHIVRFYSYFEDSSFIYIILELCSKKSMMELHKRRKILSEPEIRYYVRQIALACLYLHENKIIHRDLKLGNIFINDDMKLKLGDFGLATRYDGERKLTLCGTPNYLAPEILLKTGHSFQVDVWSLGCIVYTLAVGTPPFETPDLNDTYKRIKENQYTIPEGLSPPLKEFIESMLRANPEQRPTMTSILEDTYLTGSYIPRSLPISCLTTAPRSHTGRLSILPNALEKMALNSQTNLNGIRSPLHPVTNTDDKPKTAVVAASTKRDLVPVLPAVEAPKPQSLRKRSHPDAVPEDANLKALVKQLTDCLIRKRVVTFENGCSDAEDPMSAPIYWISKWVDFSDRYGLGFALCDNSYGVRFNDVTTLIMLASENENQLQYIDATGGEYFFSKANMPSALRKKVELLKYFRNYMNKYLANTGNKIREEESMARLPYVSNWFRTRTALVFHLTNGTLQVHFFDHVKLVLCPLLGACTFFNAENEVHTYRLDLISIHGATSDIYKRLKYALDCVNHLREQTQSSDGATTVSTRKPECQTKPKAAA